MRAVLASLLAALILCPTAPRAQDAPVMFQGLAGQLAMNDLLWAPLRSSIARQEERVATRPPAPTKPAAAASTAYRQDPVVSQRVMRQFAAFVARQANHPDPAAVEAQLRQAGLLEKWNTIWNGDGLRQGDVVDAQVSYFLANWIIANDSGDIPASRTRATREQMRPMITATPEIARLSEGQRQELAEVLMLNGVTQLIAYVQAKETNNRAMLAQLAQAATTRFQAEAQVDLRQLRLTDRGLVPG